MLTGSRIDLEELFDDCVPCTHEEGPLAEGDIEGHEVTCPWHGARFDIRTGEVLCAPAYGDVTRYNVRVTGANIEVEV